MTARLQAVFIRDIGEGARIIDPGEKHELAGNGLYRRIFMAFQAWHFIVSGGLPFLVIGRNKMTYLTVFRRREYHAICVIKKPYRDNYKKEYEE